MSQSTREPTPGRPYPRRCPSCREMSVFACVESRTINPKYDGRKYTLKIDKFPLDRCKLCDFSALDIAADEAINHALREHLQLLHPEEIRANRKSLDLKQKQLADAIGCAFESISRWETGTVVQSQSYDRLLRAYFHLPQLRSFFDMLLKRRLTQA